MAQAVIGWKFPLHSDLTDLDGLILDQEAAIPQDSAAYEILKMLSKPDEEPREERHIEADPSHSWRRARQKMVQC